MWLWQGCRPVFVCSSWLRVAGCRRVRGALALRNFCEFGLHGTREKCAKQPSLKAQAAEDAPAKSAAPDAPPLGSYLSGAHVGMWVSGSARDRGKILGVIAFFRSEGNDQRER